MNRRWMTVALACSGTAALIAQPPPMMRHGGPGGPGGAPPAMGGPGMVRFGGDMKVVKGQPYSAEVANETTQVLGDGTRIVKKTAGAVYRDTDGRTRHEETPAGAQDRKSVNIFDPVAATSWTLNPSAKTASKHAIHVPQDSGGGANGMHRQGPLPGTGADRAGHGPGRPNSQNRATEDLGMQAIEGVQAQGRRTTVTIPAGQMGNDRDMKIVDEVWFSPDLQVVVQSRHSDPFTGDVTYKLTNVRRGDPPHSLFEAPADYQVKEEGKFNRRPAGGAPEVRE